MVDGISRVPWRLRIQWLSLAAIVPLLLAVATACSGAAPTPGQTTIAPPPTSTPASPAANAATTTPTAMAPRVPTSTVAPTESTARTTPLPAVVPTESTDQAIDAEKLIAIEEASDGVYQFLKELIAELGNRASGSEEELIAAEYLKQQYQSMGYDAEIQPFTVRRFDFHRWVATGGENARVSVQSPDGISFSGLPLSSLPPDTTVSGPLLTLDLTVGGQFPESGLEGKVVQLLFGDRDLHDIHARLSLQAQVNWLAEAGAVAVVLSRKLGEPIPYQPLYAVEPLIPALFISKEEGTRLLDLAAQAEELIVSVHTESELVESRNVIAEMKGTGDDVVVVGAHYDTVPEGSVGANDNASGTAVILALAEALSGKSLPFTVRFLSFGAEEVGLLGSRHYVASLSDTELERVKAMLNFDSVGSGAYTAVSGYRELTEAAFGLAEDLQVQAQTGLLPRGAASDHAPFEIAGVPVLFLWAPDISRINSPRDTLEFLDPQRLGETFLLAEALLTSPEFPPR